MQRKQQRLYVASAVVLIGVGGVFAFVNAYSEPNLVARVKSSVFSLWRSSRAADLAPKSVGAEGEAELRAAAESVENVSSESERENSEDNIEIISQQKSVNLVNPGAAITRRTTPARSPASALPPPFEGGVGGGIVPPGFGNNPVAAPPAAAANSVNHKTPATEPAPQSPQPRFSFGDGGGSGGAAPPSTPADTTPPAISSLTTSFSGVNIRISVSASDVSGVTRHEGQLILADFVSGTPRTACAGENQTERPATSTLLQDTPALFTQLLNTPCTWFKATSSASPVIIALAADLDGMNFVTRARATDGAGNTSDWVYAEAIPAAFEEQTPSATSSVVISEVAWMGTAASPNDEWIELFNPSAASTSLAQWQLVWGVFNSTTGRYERAIDLSGLTIGPYRTIVLERTNDTTISDRAADKIYTGALGNGGEQLRLLNNNSAMMDEVNAVTGWFAGNNSTKETMSRRDFFGSGNLPASWCTFLSCPNDGLFAAPQSGRDANNSPLNGSPGQPRVE